jgi:hypothetical protein
MVQQELNTAILDSGQIDGQFYLFLTFLPLVPGWELSNELHRAEISVSQCFLTITLPTGQGLSRCISQGPSILLVLGRWSICENGKLISPSVLA